MKKSQNMPVWLSKMVVALHWKNAKIGKRHNRAKHLLLIGLLSVVSHIFAVPILVLWVGLEKK
jgi:hypothetical protein